ncbi:MAG: hypothetical protein J0653_00080, partial [Deltaproteobacteria bacterium]|nr:hypothetical protein [Deltaproteobacteria bacterium]
MLPLITDDRFITLVKTIPCLIESGQTENFSPGVLQAFEEAGCRTVQPTSFHHSHQQSKPVLAANTGWLAGDWYLAPPLKLSGNQAASRTLSLKLL